MGLRVPCRVTGQPFVHVCHRSRLWPAARLPAGGLSWGQWAPSLRLATCAALRGPPLTPPCVMFAFSIAPLTTAWTSGRCGFTGCITRTRANGEKAPACSGGFPRPGWVWGGRPQGPRGFPHPMAEKEPLSPPSGNGAPPGERGALPRVSSRPGHPAVTRALACDHAGAGTDREAWPLPVEAAESVLTSQASCLRIWFLTQSPAGACILISFCCCCFPGY